jgi:hypothetical protein
MWQNSYPSKSAWGAFKRVKNIELERRAFYQRSWGMKSWGMNMSKAATCG